MNLLETGSGGTFPAAPSSLLLVVAVIVLDAYGGLLALLEPLVLAVRPEAVLYHHGGVRHLFVVRVLLVPPEVVLYEHRGRPLLVLLLLPALVGPVGLLDDLGRLVQFPLLAICGRNDFTTFKRRRARDAYLTGSSSRSLSRRRFPTLGKTRRSRPSSVGGTANPA